MILLVCRDRDPLFHRKTVPATLLLGFRSRSRLTIKITIDGKMGKLFGHGYVIVAY